MGREIKRVALDFAYPINKMIWKGYANPYSGMKCEMCDGSGESPEFKKLSEDWYGFERPENKWCYSLTQDEVQALFDEGRLRDFHSVPSAEEVNRWAQHGFGHDSINHWICSKIRAERMGITELDCTCCKGTGELWADDKYAKLAEDFEFIDPPSGNGYQLWNTITEGTPMSPVFKTPKNLATWLVDNKISSFAGMTETYDTWLNFIENSGFALSMVFDGKELKSGVDAATKGETNNVV